MTYKSYKKFGIGLAESAQTNCFGRPAHSFTEGGTVRDCISATFWQGRSGDWMERLEEGVDDEPHGWIRERAQWSEEGPLLS